MPPRPYSYQPYQCAYCSRTVHVVVDAGKTRQLWCGRCACRRTFERMDERLRAETWPPPARRAGRRRPKKERTP